MREHSYKVEILDADIIRKTLSAGLGFSRADREENIRRIGFLCQLLTRNGVCVIAAVISPYQAIRDEVRQMVGSDFLEIYLDCPLAVCIERDVKGMYKKALAGDLKGFTGIDDIYEVPPNPDLSLPTDRESKEESLLKILELLRSRGYMDQDITK